MFVSSTSSRSSVFLDNCRLLSGQKIFGVDQINLGVVVFVQICPELVVGQFSAPTLNFQKLRNLELFEFYLTRKITKVSGQAEQGTRALPREFLVF